MLRVMPFFLVSTLCSIESLILSFDYRDYCVPSHSNAFQNGAHSVGSIVWTIVGRGHSIIDVPQLSAMSFVAALKNTLEYIVAAIDDDDSNPAEVVQQQVDHLFSVFRQKGSNNGGRYEIIELPQERQHSFYARPARQTARGHPRSWLLGCTESSENSHYQQDPDLCLLRELSYRRSLDSDARSQRRHRCNVGVHH